MLASIIGLHSLPDIVPVRVKVIEWVRADCRKIEIFAFGLGDLGCGGDRLKQRIKQRTVRLISDKGCGLFTQLLNKRGQNIDWCNRRVWRVADGIPVWMTPRPW